MSLIPEKVVARPSLGSPNLIWVEMNAEGHASVSARLTPEAAAALGRQLLDAAEAVVTTNTMEEAVDRYQDLRQQRAFGL